MSRCRVLSLLFLVGWLPTCLGTIRTALALPSQPPSHLRAAWAEWDRVYMPYFGNPYFGNEAGTLAWPASLLLDDAQDVELMSLHASALEADADHSAQHDFEVEWQRFQSELNDRPRHFLRASIENLFFLGIGSALYWHDASAEDRDLDLPPRLSSLVKKITGEAVRMDHNLFVTNTFNHAFAGSGYYLVGRSNGYRPFESFLFSLAASTVWEFFGEYVEYVSINDQIFTPVGGTAIGEVLYQLGEFFTTSANTTTNNVLKWIFGPFSNFHRWLDGTPTRRAAEMDRFGFRKDIWHQFDLVTGLGKAGDTSIGELNVETQLIQLPGYGTRLGDISAWLNSTFFTQMQLRSSFAADGVQDFTLFFKAMFLGYFRQHLTGPKDGPWHGYSFFIGPGLAYEFNTHQWSDTGIDDQYGIINLLGPSLHWTFYQGALRLRMHMAVYGDFAAIRAFALDAFKQVGSVEGAKSVLHLRDYYYALGMTTRVRGSLQYDRLEVGMHGRYSYYNSIEGLDIDEDEITNDVKTEDTIATVGTWIAYEVLHDIMHVTFSYERRWRSGTATDGSVRARESETENRFVGSLLFSF